MKILLLLVGFGLVCGVLNAQSFEISVQQDLHKGSIGDLIRAPLYFKNKTEKPITLVLRKTETQIGGTQKSFFCPDNSCLDARTEDYILKIDAGQTLQNFSISLEAGLVEGFSTLKYVVYNKANPAENFQLELNFIVESRPEKSRIYTSRFITVNDVYPNPVTDYANIEYQLHADEVKAKIVIHNILGNAITEYELPHSETKIKVLAEQLNAGIYFYTLYIDNEGVMTRKLIVKK